MTAWRDLGWGFLAGLLCALGGAVKDVVGGAVAYFLAVNGVAAFAVAGYFERAAVEGWKIVALQRAPAQLDQLLAERSFDDGLAHRIFHAVRPLIAQLAEVCPE